MKKSMKIVLSAIAAFLVLMPGLAGCGGGDGSSYSPPAATVAEIVNCAAVTPAQAATIEDNFFNPAAVPAISVNDVIQWSNAGAVQHTVTSGNGTPDGKFNSGTLNFGGSVCMRFLVAGTYPYYCTFHGVAMSGTVTVTP